MRLCNYCSPRYPDYRLSSNLKPGLCSECYRIRLTREVLNAPPSGFETRYQRASCSQMPGVMLRLWLSSIGLLTVLGVLILLAGGGLVLYEQYLASTYPAVGQGTIVALWDVHSYRGISANYVRFTYQAPTAAGQNFTVTDEVSNERFATLAVGQTIAIRYDPVQPERSRLDQFNERIRRLVILAVGVGILTIIMDIFAPAFRTKG